jgi:hypothetical protein
MGRGSGGVTLRHHLREIGEQMIAVVWTGRRFGMTLDREDRQIAVLHALDTTIIEIGTGDLQNLW